MKCNHEKVTLRRRIYSNGFTHYVTQCDSCLAQTGSVGKTKVREILERAGASTEEQSVFVEIRAFAIQE
jgi:hypothetical protein